jgi:hypothetical protein
MSAQFEFCLSVQAVDWPQVMMFMMVLSFGVCSLRHWMTATLAPDLTIFWAMA